MILGSYMLSWSQLDLNWLRVNCDNSYIHIYMKLNHNSLQWYSHWRFPLGLEIGTDFTIFRIAPIKITGALCFRYTNGCEGICAVDVCKVNELL